MHFWESDGLSNTGQAEKDETDFAVCLLQGKIKSMVRSHPRKPLLLWGILLLALFTSQTREAKPQFGSPRRPSVHKRAKPPTSWAPGVENQFFSDAFAELEGPRPDFSALSNENASMPESGVPASTNGSSVSWSSLISPEVLADEIKSKKLEIDKIVRQKREFIGGGYRDARKAFSSIAAAFGVISVYNGDVRWKDYAPRARDRFAGAATECSQGNDASFAVATQAAEDLQTLINGSRLEGPVAKEILWQRIAAFQPLMSRLEQAEKGLAEVSASESAFKEEPERLLHESEIVAMIGEFIQQPEFEYFDDESYLEYAAAMRDAAVQVATATREGDFAAAQKAVSAVRKSCSDCHGDYR